MVSGLVTSPCDQERIFSGLASEMRIASKSVIGLVSSNGLERYKTSSIKRIIIGDARCRASPGLAYFSSGLRGPAPGGALPIRVLNLTFNCEGGTRDGRVPLRG